MLVRRATLADLDALLPLVRAYRLFYKQNADALGERAFISARLCDGTTVAYVAEEGGELLGFTQLFKTYSTVHLASAWILEDLFVVPQRRGAGIATALLERAVGHARADGASGMFLETAYDNASAQRVYERAGWSREGRFYKYNAPL